jgi:hypothetical protein
MPRPIGVEPVSFRLTQLTSLDGLRGIAILAVMLNNARYLPGGFLGVDIFFVLSAASGARARRRHQLPMPSSPIPSRSRNEYGLVSRNYRSRL